MTSPSDPSADDTSPRSGLVRALVILTVVALVVGVAGAVVGLLAPRLGGDDQDRRDAVVSRVEAFATTYNEYDVAKKSDYQQRMRPLLTSSYYTQFAKVTDTLFDALKDKKQKSTDPKVLGVAISSLDDDSAVALVAVNASITTGTDAAVVRRFRWQVTLAKSGGTWRVSQFDSVNPLEAETGQPTTEPSATPSPSTTTKGGGE